MNFLQTIKCCYQVRVQATSLLKRNTHWSLSGYGYMRENLIDLGEYSTHWDVANMPNLFYFYSVFIRSRGMTP